MSFDPDDTGTACPDGGAAVLVTPAIWRDPPLRYTLLVAEVRKPLRGREPHAGAVQPVDGAARRGG